VRFLLVNPNTTQRTTDTMVAIAREAAPEDTIIGATAAFGAPLLVDEAMLAKGAVAVEALFAAYDFAGFDGAIVAAFGDPALETVRNTCPVPVTGIAEASMLEAAGEGRRFVVATTTPLLVDAIGKRAASLGLADLFAGVRLTQGDINALMADPAALERELAAACEIAMNRDGARAIVIGGGPLAVAARALAPRFSVPIVEPIPAAVRLAQSRAAAR
jgi:allantoin racemase